MNIETEASKRITLKRAHANSLFQEWLADLYKQALNKENNNTVKDSKLRLILKEALDSISKYPLPLTSGAECIILKGFHKKLCMFLDRQLIKHFESKSPVQNISSTGPPESDIGPPESDIGPPEYDIGPPEYDIGPPESDIVNIDTSLQSQNKNNSHSQISNSNNNPSSSSVAHVASAGGEELETNTNTISETKSAKNKSCRGRKYNPAFRSGPYAILRALFEEHLNNRNHSISKEELIEKAQIYCEESFVRPKPDTHYTAWSNMTRLLTKNLVAKVGNKKVKYQLTADGLQLAKVMLDSYKDTSTENDIIFNDAHPSCTSKERDINVEVTPTENNIIFNDAHPPCASEERYINVEVPASQSSQKDDYTVIEFSPSTFDIILLIDKNETGGVSKKNDPTVSQFNKFVDLNHEYRNLKVGDFTWIARHQVYKHQEITLPYIVERKRMDDLAASIKDGRYHEQKFRLRKCGIPNVIYLVENYGKNKHLGLPLQNLQQALENTRVQDGFKIHMTDSLKHSARFLAMLTKRLTIRYKDKALKGRNAEPNDEYLMTFEYFIKASVKSKILTVTDTFIKLLLQLKGVSVDKALAITVKYKTPKSLLIEYEKCDRNEGELLLANLKYGVLGRKIGRAVSKAIYQLFSDAYKPVI